MIVTDLHLRLLLGSLSILVGCVLLKCYIDRGKNTAWGLLFACGTQHRNNRRMRRLYDVLYLATAGLSIVAGLIAICFGFRMNI